MLNPEEANRYHENYRLTSEYQTPMADILKHQTLMMQESAKREAEMKQAQHENIITMIEIFIPIISLIILIVFLSKKYKTLTPIIFDKIFRYISILASLALIAFMLYGPATSSTILKKRDIIIIIPVLTLACINLFTLLKISTSSIEDSPHSTKTNMLSNMIRRKNLEDEIKTLEAEKRLKELKEELHKTTDNIETDQKGIIPPPEVQDNTESQEITPSQTFCTDNPLSHSQNSTIQASNEELPQSSPPEVTDSEYTKDEAATLSPVLSLKGLLSINGRRRRRQYFIISLFLSFFHKSIDTLPGVDEIWFLILPLLLFVTYLQIVNNAKRFHDLNQPTLYAVVYCILAALLTTFVDITKMRFDTSSPLTFVLLIIWVTRIYLIFASGTEGSNHYGRSIEELKSISK